MSTSELIKQLKIKVFADGANIDGIVSMSKNPLITGYTTNPTLMRKAGVQSYEKFVSRVTLDSQRSACLA